MAKRKTERKMTDEERREERTYEAHKLLTFLRHATGRAGFEPAPLVATWTGDAWGGRVRMTATWYGWRRVGGGAVEIVLQPMRDDGQVGAAAPTVEVWAHPDLSDGLALHVLEEPTYRAPWSSALRTLLTDTVRARRAADELAAS